jgi:hypothetical protein
MSAFTDDDVILGTQAAIAHYKAERGITGNTYMWEGVEPQVSAVLAAVAPTIAARAQAAILREMASQVTGNNTIPLGREQTRAWLRYRADEIERTP